MTREGKVLLAEDLRVFDETGGITIQVIDGHKAIESFINNEEAINVAYFLVNAVKEHLESTIHYFESDPERAKKRQELIDNLDDALQFLKDAREIAKDELGR
mgnify:CR=1 FL=1